MKIDLPIKTALTLALLSLEGDGDSDAGDMLRAIVYELPDGAVIHDPNAEPGRLTCEISDTFRDGGKADGRN